MNALIVRLGALGDIVHAIPAVAALRRAWPEARLDWVVDAKHRAIVDLVDGVDHVIAVDGRTLQGWTRAVRELRAVRYDVAIDLQGLLKSAVLARASGAAQLLETVGVHDGAIAFPLKPIASTALEALRARIGPAASFALINPGAAWPNKRWPADRFGEVAAFLREACGLVPVVLWGPGEDALAGEVMAAASGAAVLAPPTRVADVIALAREAAVVVSGDTGPLHLAVAAGAPIVSVFGPTDPGRNGPIAPDDIALSRYDACGCHYDRRCHQHVWCLSGLAAAELCAAVQRRLGGRGVRG
jgi:heptosyltransferase-1